MAHYLVIVSIEIQCPTRVACQLHWTLQGFRGSLNCTHCGLLLAGEQGRMAEGAERKWEGEIEREG